MIYFRNLRMEAEMEGKNSFFNEIFLIIGWMVLRELHKGSSLEILTARRAWQG